MQTLTDHLLLRIQSFVQTDQQFKLICPFVTGQNIFRKLLQQNLAHQWEVEVRHFRNFLEWLQKLILGTREEKPSQWEYKNLEDISLSQCILDPVMTEYLDGLRELANYLRFSNNIPPLFTHFNSSIQLLLIDKFKLLLKLHVWFTFEWTRLHQWKSVVQRI